TGIKVKAHTNTLEVLAEDTQGKDGNKDGSYSGGSSTADAYIARADLKLEKNAVGGVVSGATDVFGDLATGTWIAGQGPVSGKYEQPAWEITITNQGPDTGYGPFVVEDTLTLDAGITTGEWTARYYSGAGDTTGTDLGTFS